MSKVKFFSNTIILLDHKENEIALSLKNTREDLQQIFQVPEHNLNTKNLMVFVDGNIKIPDIDYTDINSSQIEFVEPLDIGQTFYAILVKTGRDEGYSETVEWEDF